MTGVLARFTGVGAARARRRCVPCGFVEGLPVAMQLLGRPFEEATRAARRARLPAGDRLAPAPAGRGGVGGRGAVAPRRRPPDCAGARASGVRAGARVGRSRRGEGWAFAPGRGLGVRAGAGVGRSRRGEGWAFTPGLSALPARCRRARRGLSSSKGNVAGFGPDSRALVCRPAGRKRSAPRRSGVYARSAGTTAQTSAPAPAQRRSASR